tara:strand:+ start:179 stop:514 length:336 start_codon:yes stop_codon:yes gene_type:complete
MNRQGYSAHMSAMRISNVVDKAEVDQETLDNDIAVFLSKKPNAIDCYNSLGDYIGSKDSLDGEMYMDMDKLRACMLESLDDILVIGDAINIEESYTLNDAVEELILNLDEE